MIIFYARLLRTKPFQFSDTHPIFFGNGRPQKFNFRLPAFPPYLACHHTDFLLRCPLLPGIVAAIH